MYRYLLYVYILVIIIAVSSSTEVIYQTHGKIDGWFNNEAWFSDWRGVMQIDYATNVAVARYYTGSQCNGLRKENYDEISKRLISGESLLFGADYYALFGMSSFYFPPEFLQKYYNVLVSGGVVVCRMTQRGEETQCEILQVKEL